MYRVRRMWRHFKYRLLELFFGKPELKRLIDLDRLDFEDAVRITRLQEEKWLTPKEYEYFFGDDAKKFNLKYGLQYDLARQMAATLAKHIEVSSIYDTDERKYLCVGTLNTVELK